MRNTYKPYKELNCIIGTGTQYIDTLYKFTDNTHKHRFVIRYAKTGTSVNNQTHNFGSSTSSDTFWFNGFTDANYGYSTQCYMGSTGRIVWIMDYTLAIMNLDFTLQNNTTILVINGTTTTPTYSSTIVSNANIFLFCASKGTVPWWTKKSSMKLYYCQIYENDVIVRDFIPVLYNNIPCLFDKVTQTYFYNAGTGTFGYE